MCQVYGMPQSPIDGFQTYMNYHKFKLKMPWTKLEPSVLSRKMNDANKDLSRVHVDQPISEGTPNVTKKQATAYDAFPSKTLVKIEKKWKCLMQ